MYRIDRPELSDGGATAFRIRFAPHRNVAVDEVFQVDVGHGDPSVVDDV
jgi:hypothetical protein